MAGPLAKLQILLGLDATEVEKGVGRATKATSGFSSGAKVAFGLAAGAATIGFGLMSKGALEMERAQGDFQAATGKSREEAVQFSKDMNGLVGTAATVGRSFNEIAGAGTAVAQQFGLTGKAGTGLTEDFLAFSKVTRQDATGAVNDFDAALDAFGEPAERATGLMDQLVASNQKYGTDAGPAAVDALKNMAPALTAMGLGLDYGIGALNLFEEAGIDATTGQMAFNKAVDDIPPGGSFDDIIAKIGAIEDPLLRDAAAVEIFGEKAGHKMALAIKPGMTSLDEFQVSMAEVDGTSQTAAENMVTTGDKFKMFGEKAIGALRGLGQEFGPLLSGLGGVTTALSGIGIPVAGKLLDMFKGLAAKVLPQAVIAGAAIGTSTGGAQGTAHAAAATGPSAIKALFIKIAAMGLPLAPAGTTIGTAVGGAMGVGMIAGLFAAAALAPALPLIIEKLLGEDAESKFATAGVRAAAMYASGFSDEIKTGYAAAVQQAFDEARASGLAPEAVGAAGKAAGDAYLASMSLSISTGAAAAIASNTDPITTAFGDYMTVLADRAAEGGQFVVQSYTDAERQALLAEHQGRMSMYVEQHREFMLGVHKEAAWGGAETPGAFSEGLRSSFDNVRTAFDDLKDLMLNTLSPVQQETELIGIATSKRLANALDDGRPEVRSAAQQIALDTIAKLQALNPASTEIGTLTTLLLARALPNERPALQDAINGIINVVENPMEQLADNAKTYGDQIGSRFVGGIKAALAQGYKSTKDAFLDYKSLIATNSPPPPGNVFYGVGGWGENTGKEWGRGMVRGLQKAQQAVKGALGFDVSGLLAPAPGMTLAGVGADGGTGPITVHAYGYQPDDVERQINRAQRRAALRASLQGGIGRADI